MIANSYFCGIPVKPTNNNVTINMRCREVLTIYFMNFLYGFLDIRIVLSAPIFLFHEYSATNTRQCFSTYRFLEDHNVDTTG